MDEEGKPDVPPRALVISILCLVVPMGLTATGVGGDDMADLIWLAALVPAFLLSYHRSWFGAAAALALGMVAITLTHAVLLATGQPPLSPEVMLWTTGALVVVGLGAGTMATMLHHSKGEAERMALADPGTGLPNRRRALLHLEKAFASARRGGRLALILFDLDHFKRINDQYGHAVGDDVLLDFARILDERTREMDLSARVGGEEFLTLMEDCDEASAVEFAEDVRAALADIDFPWGTVTASAGIALHQSGMAAPDVLMAAADQALYASKQAGRDRVSVASGSTSAPGTDLFLSGLKTSAERAGKGELLLVVDDDEAARQSVAKALRRFRFEVLEAGTPERALQIVEGLDEPPALLLTDVIMPSMSGFRLVELLMGEIRDLRVIYLSGYLSEESGWRGAPGRVRAFLQKPVSLDELSVAVRRVLDEPTAGVVDDVAAASGAAPPEPEGATAPADPHPDFPILVTASDEEDLATARIRLRHLGYEDVAGHLLGDPPSTEVRPAVLVAWIESFWDDVLDTLEELRGSWPSHPDPPLLLVAPAFPPSLAGRWEDLFPAVFLPTSTGLPELGLHMEHLRRVHELLGERAGERRAMEARVQARTAEVESAHRDVLYRLARAAEIRDDLTGHHAERVGLLAARLGAELGVPSARISIIRLAAPLHDLGKIAIPDAILNKPSGLTTIERQVMERHTEIGAQLLSGSRHPLLQEAEQIARSHHEHWDGGGYPHRIRGEEIPLSARLVAVADVFDSVTHTRPYREASSLERALSIISDGKGSHFDPDVARALRALARRDELEIDPDEALVAAPDVTPVSPLEIREMLEEFQRP